MVTNFIQAKSYNNTTVLINMNSITSIAPYINGDRTSIFIEDSDECFFIIDKPFEEVTAALRIKDAIHIINLC